MNELKYTEEYARIVIKLFLIISLFGNKVFRILILLLILFPSTSSFAQNRKLNFRNLDLRLSDLNTYCIIQDYKGYMWFATENGLNRYDGVSIKVYSKKNNDSTSLSNNRGTAIFETKNHNLWVGTTSGLNLYNRAKDCFVRYSYKQQNTSEKVYDFIYDITEDNEGNLWLATSGGLCVVDKKKKTTIPFGEFTKSQSKLKVTNITSIQFYGKEKILAGNIDGHLFEFNIKRGSITELMFDNGGSDVIKLRSINRILITDNYIWISTLGTGLLRIKKIENAHLWYNQYIHSPLDTNTISADDINDICELNTEHLLVGTVNNGLNILNYKSNTFKHILKDSKQENTIPGNSILRFYKDYSHNIWIGFFSYGVSIIDSLVQNFSAYKNNINNTYSLCSSPITGFVEDKKGNVWISSDGSGLDYWDRKTNKFTHFKHNPHNKNSPLSDAAVCIFKTKKSEILAGFYNGGISILGKDKKWRKYLTKEDGLSSNDVFSIAEDDKGNIYIATYRGGLNVYNPKTKKLTAYTTDDSDKNSIGGNNVNLLFMDSKDNLWIGLTNKGFDLMQKDELNKTAFKHYRNNTLDSNGLSDNTVFAITEDTKGNIWIGTGDGLNKLNIITQKITVYRTTGGVAENTIVGIIGDENGKLWLSTLNGISLFNPENGNFKIFNESDGIHGLRFNIRAAYYKNKSGEFFFGGITGFTSFHPDSIQFDSSFYRLYFTDFKLFNKSVIIDTDGSPLSKHISETEKIILNHIQNIFTIEYAALNFKNPGKTQYAYMLENFETDWNYVGKKKTATYTNLDAGSYVFKVKCTNNAGDWSKKATTLEIIVLPPWWATWWFRLSSAAFLLLLLFAFYKLRVKAIKKQRRILEETVKERTFELSEINTALEEKSKKVFEQKEEIQVQAEVLEKANYELEENTKELSTHKNELENLVKIRTAELEKSIKKAEESDRLKSAFLANMSHEIRTPMNAIVGFSQLLNLPDVNNQEKERYVNQICANTDSLLVLIEDILDLSRIESDQISVIKEKFFINTLLEEVFSSILVSHKNKNVALRLVNKEADKNILINSDRVRVKQILINLFSNACKFTEKGYVYFGFEIKKDKLMFYTEDTGIGISEENIGTVFERFSKLADNKTKLFRGSGLGLAISKKIALLLDGDLLVQSEFGSGSIFTFWLPDSVIIRQ